MALFKKPCVLSHSHSAADTRILVNDQSLGPLGICEIAFFPSLLSSLDLSTTRQILAKTAADDLAGRIEPPPSKRRADARGTVYSCYIGCG